MVMKTASRPCGKVKQYGQDRDLGNAEPYQSLQEGKNMYHDFESHTITRRSFLKGAGAGCLRRLFFQHRSQCFVGFFRRSCFQQGPERTVYLRDFWP